jgi:hypothetical protein
MEKKLTAKAPAGCRGQIIATVRTERNYFSVTGEISTERERAKGNCQSCGCIHEEVLNAFPQLAPLVALHLSDLDGVPMHAEANGFYWLAGNLGGLGAKYHGGSGRDGKSAIECLRIFAEHMRISDTEAQVISTKVQLAFKAGFEAEADGDETHKTKAGNIAARNVFHDYVQQQRNRWKAEAEAGLALIQTL